MGNRLHLSTYVLTEEDIRSCLAAGVVSEVLIETDLLAKQGKLPLARAEQLAMLAADSGLKPVLVWDLLLAETDLESVCREIANLNLEAYGALRVRDLGAAQWLKDWKKDSIIQLIAEQGNNNIEALHGWCEYFGNQLEKIILSIELTEDNLASYCHSLPVKCEILGAGAIELFYTPRRLLSACSTSNSRGKQFAEEVSKVLSFSADSGNRLFPTLETRHGTMMFLDKDHFILDKLDRLIDAGLDTIRIDLRHLSSGKHAAEGIAEIGALIQNDNSLSRSSWPSKTLSPFFRTNKTTAQFSKLKSQLHLLRDDSCLAQLLAGARGRYQVFLSLRDFCSVDVNTLVLPTGREVEAEGIVLRGLDGEPLGFLKEGDVFLGSWIKYGCPGSLLRGAFR